jgi:hypothetical protein
MKHFVLLLCTAALWLVGCSRSEPSEAAAAIQTKPPMAAKKPVTPNLGLSKDAVIGEEGRYSGAQQAQKAAGAKAVP